MDEVWKTPSRGNFTFDEMCNQIRSFINEDNEKEYEISVGTDSQRHKDYTRFVSAIIVHRVGKGAQYYWCYKDMEHIKSLRQKIMYEASLTYDYKEQLKENLRSVLAVHHITVKPHIDIGINGETKKFITEIKGMFKGFGKGEEAEIKPFSNAASSVANKHSK